jgi:hypothetical protein
VVGIVRPRLPIAIASTLQLLMMRLTALSIALFRHIFIVMLLQIVRSNLDSPSAWLLHFLTVVHEQILTALFQRPVSALPPGVCPRPSEVFSCAPHVWLQHVCCLRAGFLLFILPVLVLAGTLLVVPCAPLPSPHAMFVQPMATL